MSLYELNDLFVSRQTIVMTMLALYLTLMSGFLVIIHVVGSRLSRLQIIAVCAVYYAWAITHLAAMSRYALQMRVVEQRIEAVAPDYLGDPLHPVFQNVITPIVLLGTLVLPLLFVWELRRKKGHQ